MVVDTEKPRVRAWYVCALLHYQGDDLWTVGLLRRSIGPKTIRVADKWEYVENLDFESASEFIKATKSRLVKFTPADLKKVIVHG